MKKALFKTLSFAFICALITFSAQAQAPATPAAGETKPVTVKTQPKIATSASKTAKELPPSNDHSLNGQYQDLLRRSWTQQGYKVINQSRLNGLWKSVQDSLRAEKGRYPVLQSKIAEQAATIEGLKKQVATGEENLQKSTAAVNEVSLLGVGVDKSTYNTVMWGAVIILAAALLIVLFTAGKSIREAKYRRQLYDEVLAEYQSYKVKANEKEKKLARELQTERNRIEELLDKNK